jgi:hypothetical protein
MNAARLAEITEGIRHTRGLVRRVRTTTMDGPAVRQALNDVEERLCHALAALTATDAAWETDAPTFAYDPLHHVETGPSHETPFALDE